MRDKKHLRYRKCRRDIIPHMRESAVKRRLQEIDNLICEATNTPSVRFVERYRGSTITDLLGRANLWAID